MLLEPHGTRRPIWRRSSLSEQFENNNSLLTADHGIQLEQVQGNRLLSVLKHPKSLFLVRTSLRRSENNPKSLYVSISFNYKSISRRKRKVNKKKRWKEIGCALAWEDA